MGTVKIPSQPIQIQSSP